MEIAGSAYLYTLAVVATTFAGLAALTMIFRQILGGKFTKLDAFVMRSFIQLGFMSTGGSLLPPLLALFPIPVMNVWRATSAILALLLGAWALTFPRRRHAASQAPAPKPIYFVIAIYDLTAAALAANAIFTPAGAVVGIYSTSMTIILAGGATFFLLSMIYLFARPIELSQPHPEDYKT